MRKVLHVARTEYLNAVRTKAFIVGVALMPLLVGVAIAVQVFASKQSDTSDRRFAVVDATGRLQEAIERRAARRNEQDIFEEENGKRRQKRPRFLPEVIPPGKLEETDGETGEERLDLALSDRVRAGDLFAFVVIEAGAVPSGPEGHGAISYYTETPTYTELPEWLEDVISDEVRELRLDAAKIDEETVNLVHRLTQPVRIRRLGLVSVGEEGEIEEAREENDLVTFGIPGAAMFLMFMLVMMSSPQLLNTVLEEKMQRISELLVSAISPFQLMLGKVLGTVLVAATLAFLYVGGVLVVAHHYGVAGVIPDRIWVWFPVFLLLALFMYGSVFAALGAACSELRDAQSLVTPVMLLIMLPLFFWTIVLQSPDSSLSRLVSLFPPAIPTLLLLRIAIPPGPPWWEIALGLVLALAFMVLCVWAGAKVFRIGILSHGQAPSLRRLLVWVVSK